MHPSWMPERPKLRLLRAGLSLVIGVLALWVAAATVPGVEIGGVLGALGVAVLIAAVNAILPPLVALLPLPLTLVTGFLLILALDALILKGASSLTDRAITVSSFAVAFVAGLVVAAVQIVLEVIA